MEIPQKLREQISEKSQEGFLKTLEFILEQREIKEVFPSFEMKEFEMEELKIKFLSGIGFSVNHSGVLDVSVRQFHKDVFVLQAILKEVFPNYQSTEEFSDDTFYKNGELKEHSIVFREDAFDENGELKEHYKEMDDMLDPQIDSFGAKFAGIILIFDREITRQKIIVDLSDEKKKEFSLDGEIQKEIFFFQSIHIVFSHLPP